MKKSFLIALIIFSFNFANAIEFYKKSNKQIDRTYADKKLISFKYNNQNKLQSISSPHYNTSFENGELKSLEYLSGTRKFYKYIFHSGETTIHQYKNNNQLSSTFIIKRINDQKSSREITYYNKNNQESFKYSDYIFSDIRLFFELIKYEKSITDTQDLIKTYWCDEIPDQTIDEIISKIENSDEDYRKFQFSEGCGDLEDNLKQNIKDSLTCLQKISETESESIGALLLEKLRVTSLGMNKPFGIFCNNEDNNIGGSSNFPDDQKYYPLIRINTHEKFKADQKRILAHELYHSCNEPHSWDSPKEIDIVDVCAKCCENYEKNKSEFYCKLCASPPPESNEGLIAYHRQIAKLGDTGQKFLEAYKAYLLDPANDEIKKEIYGMVFKIDGSHPEILEDLIKNGDNSLLFYLLDINKHNQRENNCPKNLAELIHHEEKCHALFRHKNEISEYICKNNEKDISITEICRQITKQHIKITKNSFDDKINFIKNPPELPNIGIVDEICHAQYKKNSDKIIEIDNYIKADKFIDSITNHYFIKKINFDEDEDDVFESDSDLKSPNESKSTQSSTKEEMELAKINMDALNQKLEERLILTKELETISKHCMKK